MTQSRRNVVRRVLARIFALAAGAVILSIAISWACACAAMLASPPTGQVRAAWVTSLRVRQAGGLEGSPQPDTRGTFRAFESWGALAESCTLQWCVQSEWIEGGDSQASPVPTLIGLPAIVEPRYQATFLRWASALRPIPRAPLAYIEEASFGFPLHGLGYSMRCDYIVRAVGGAPSYEPVFTIEGGIDASRFTPYRTPRPALVLPRTVRRWDFFVNVAFWAMVLSAIFGGAAMLRGLCRIRRGRCARCNYDLRGLPPGAPCPECGNAAPGRASNPTLPA